MLLYFYIEFQAEAEFQAVFTPYVTVCGNTTCLAAAKALISDPVCHNGFQNGGIGVVCSLPCRSLIYAVHNTCYPVC